MDKVIKYIMKNILTIISILAYLFILVMCCCMFCRSVNYEPTIPVTNDYKVSLIVADKDTLLDDNSRKELDSLKALLLKLPKEEYADGINDVRQETNNIINKINGWLSFWLAIMALVGGVIPMLISWKQEKDNTAQFEFLKQQQDKNIKILKTEIDLEVSKLQSVKEEQEKTLDEYRCDFQTLHNGLRLHETQMNITNIVNSFIAAKDNHLLQEKLDRDLLRSSLLNELSREFDNIINQIFPNNYYTNANKLVLKTVLIQFHALFICMRPTLVKLYKTKQLEGILNVLKEAIEIVTEDRSSALEIETKIKEVRNEICESHSLFYNNM